MHVAPGGARASPPVRMAKGSCRTLPLVSLVPSVQPSPAATLGWGRGSELFPPVSLMMDFRISSSRHSWRPLHFHPREVAFFVRSGWELPEATGLGAAASEGHCTSQHRGRILGRSSSHLFLFCNKWGGGYSTVWYSIALRFCADRDPFGEYTTECGVL